MKNQYFGDVSDYIKYGLLRILADSGKIKIGVCWMLTANDSTRDGNKRIPNLWRTCDPDLFDKLASCNARGVKDIRQVETLRMIPSASYYNEELNDVHGDRPCYFKMMLDKFAMVDLIFFDPDTGMENKGLKPGSKGSSKYLFWREVCDAFERGYSVLVYQHFHREERGAFVERFTRELQKRTGAAEVHSFRTAHVVFLLAVQERHRRAIQPAIERIEARWGFQVQHGSAG